MLVKKVKHGYYSQRKYIQGKGFVDYISQNKDLITKPLLGDLAAFALTQGGKTLLTKIMNKTQSKKGDIDPKGVEILQNMVGNSISNIIGSGIKQF